MMRRVFIGGNWKMQTSFSKVEELIEMLNCAKIHCGDRDVVVAPPIIFLDHVKQKLRKEIKVAAQNCSDQFEGALTGETSVKMIEDIGVEWVLIGHSERRTIFKESNEFLALKTIAAQKTGLKIIACIGETLAERNSELTETVLKQQLDHLITAISCWSSVVIAYEPVWAIGTGVVATPDQAQSAHLFIRGYITQKVSATVADTLRIIYGGSVKASNVDELFQLPDIDGFLVGGASTSQDFIKIINCSRK
uniref:Triosephosphate isomerase n=1 Tax=Myxobolus squamalis TaxID=59785 RepID=A0A6B2G5P0_MYXSQ